MGPFETLKAIWNDEYPSERPRGHSFVEKLFCSLTIVLTLLSLSQLGSWFGHHKHTFMDAYVLAWGILVTLLLAVGSSVPKALVVCVAVYRLIDIVNYRIFFILVKSQQRPWTADVLRRSLIIVLINFYECVTCFAILYLRSGSIQSSTSAVLDSPFTAFYYSLVTMTTLGYGDYVPTSTIGRALVVGQLTTVIVFLIFLLPALISVFSTGLSGGQKDKRV
jgi:hypothetical protein